MPNRRAAAEVRAAGAVLWRPAGSGTQVAVIHRPKYDDWSFPKGKAEAGEHLLLTAVREIREETRLDVTLGRRLGAVRYLVGDVPKRVDYWVAWPEVGPKAGSPGEPDFVATSEVDELRWLAASRAGEQLSYPYDVQTLDRFRTGPRHTVPLIVLRHSSAGSKAAWPGDDLSRPLDSGGAREAAVLASLLRCFGVARIVSSPAERCVATVRPYAAATGGEVEVEPSFAVIKGGGANGRGTSGKGKGHGGAKGGRARDGGARDGGAAKGPIEVEGGLGAGGGSAAGGSSRVDQDSGSSGGLRAEAGLRAGGGLGAGGGSGAGGGGAAWDWAANGGDAGSAVSPEAAKAAALLAASDEPVIICAHRENLPLLLEAACAELGAEIPDGGPLRKGEFLVLHRADGTVAAVERYRPDDLG